MPLSPKLTFWFEHFYPGLIASISALDAAGTFSDEDFKLRMAGADAIHGIRFALKFVFTDRHVIAITERLALKRTLAHKFGTQTVQLSDWEAYYYALRYQNPAGENILGFDLHELQDVGLQHHVHLEVHPPRERHTLAQEFEPDPRNMDPRQFVTEVEKYRRTKKLPVARKKKS